MSYEGGPYLVMEVPNEVTGQIERKYVPIPALLNTIWEEYIRDIIPDKYCREMLREIGFSETRIFHMLETLQLGKAEYLNNNYREVSYI